jgi:hypothetical protein
MFSTMMTTVLTYETKRDFYPFPSLCVRFVKYRTLAKESTTTTTTTTTTTPVVGEQVAGAERNQNETRRTSGSSRFDARWTASS